MAQSLAVVLWMAELTSMASSSTSSDPVSRWTMGLSRALTGGYATNASTPICSGQSKMPEISWKGGEWTIISIGHIVLWRTCLRLRSPKHSEKENQQQTKSLKLSETQPSSGTTSGSTSLTARHNLTDAEITVVNSKRGLPHFHPFPSLRSKSDIPGLDIPLPHHFLLDHQVRHHRQMIRTDPCQLGAYHR